MNAAVDTRRCTDLHALLRNLNLNFFLLRPFVTINADQLEAVPGTGSYRYVPGPAS
jgi:hypothetical protein